MSKLHFELNHKGLKVAACNKNCITEGYFPTTTDPLKVTCSTCMRLNGFKEAMTVIAGETQKESAARMFVAMPVEMESFGSYEVNLLSMVIDIAYNLKQGNEMENAPRVLRLAADMIEEEHS